MPFYLKSILSFYQKVKRGECDHDSECRDDRACIEHQCLDPCDISEPCGGNALCQTSSHRPVCRCPNGWGGNPHEECFQCRLISITVISTIINFEKS